LVTYQIHHHPPFPHLIPTFPLLQHLLLAVTSAPLHFLLSFSSPAVFGVHIWYNKIT
jgi:hypothetical protein